MGSDEYERQLAAASITAAEWEALSDRERWDTYGDAGLCHSLLDLWAERMQALKREVGDSA